MAPVALGLLIGTAGALLLNRVASGLLVGAESGDPLTFGSVVATMTLLAPHRPTSPPGKLHAWIRRWP